MKEVTVLRRIINWPLLRQTGGSLQGDATARENLADMYWDGRGTTKKPTLATLWYLEKCAVMKSIPYSSLAARSSEGEGVKRDYYQQAMHWYQISCGAGR